MCDFFQLPPPTECSWTGQPFYLYDASLNKGVACSSALNGGSSVMVCPTSTPTRFAPIDNNSAYDGKGERCDGFLYNNTRQNIVFVELKDRVLDAGYNELDWTNKAISQLTNTIRYFKACHPSEVSSAKIKKAYIANPQAVYVGAMSIASRRIAFMKNPVTAGFVLSKTNTIIADRQ